MHRLRPTQARRHRHRALHRRQPAPASPPEAAAPPAADPAAVSAPPGSAAPEAKPKVSLDDAVPPDDKLDWLQLKNGEWMHGELLGLRDGSVEFDSDEFDVHTVDFADVRRLFIRSKAELGLTNMEKVSGSAVLAGDKFSVTTANGVVELERAQVMSIVPSGSSELDRWSFHLTFGLNIARGNTNQGTLNGTTLLKREDGFTRFTLDYLGNYTETNGNRTGHNHRGTTRLDLFVSRVFFVTPAMFTGEYDRLKNIQFRATPAVGAGVHAINKANVTWDFTAGGGYQYTNYFSVAAGEDAQAHNGAVMLGTILDVDITDDVDFYFEYTNMLVVSDLGLTNHHLVTYLEADLTSIFDLGLRFIFDRIEDPVEREDGTTPKENDFQLIASIGIELG
jgi:putative salt-induced outer membrane protein YdiY